MAVQVFGLYLVREKCQLFSICAEPDLHTFEVGREGRREGGREGGRVKEGEIEGKGKEGKGRSTRYLQP